MLEGNNLPVDAVKAEGTSTSAHDITLENLVIRGHGNNQQIVGISTKCPAWNWVIRGVTIIGAGTGMYFGDSDGTAPFVAGLIERNVIVDSIGYNLQIKHQLARPDLPGMPGGNERHRHPPQRLRQAERRLALRGRVPSVLVGRFRREGRGAEDTLRDLRQLLLPEPPRGAVPGRGQRRALRNVFVNDYADGVRIQPHNDVPRRIAIAYNTVIAKGRRHRGDACEEGAPRYPQEVSAKRGLSQGRCPWRPRRFPQSRRSARTTRLRTSEARSHSPPGARSCIPMRNLRRAQCPGRAIARKPWPDWGAGFRRPSAGGRHHRRLRPGATPQSWTLQLDRKTLGAPAKRGS